MKAKIKNTLLFLSCVVVFSVLFIYGVDFFRITHIELQGIKSLNNLNLVNQRLIFFLNTEEFKRSLLLSNPKIESIFVEKKYPNKLLISAISVNPTSQLQVKDGWYLLSPAGRIIAKAREPFKKIAQISYFTKYPFESYSVGDYISAKEIIYATYLIDRLKKIKLASFDRVAIDHLFVIVLKNKSQELWFTTKKSKEAQFDTLKTILRNFMVTGVKFRKIDLRFSKPLVTIVN